MSSLLRRDKSQASINQSLEGGQVPILPVATNSHKNPFLPDASLTEARKNQSYTQKGAANDLLQVPLSGTVQSPKLSNSTKFQNLAAQTQK